ncbi:MAG: hypothetical protein ACD_79C00762G0001 [uncultured bacterium]|nr:MAG: hypothetical protein ACD_79C00762G0001 [uncultured bacterium]
MDNDIFKEDYYSNFERNIRLNISYNGFHYHGWQIQSNAKTIQGEIKEAISVFIKDKIRIFGASRTDTGVHALGQVANFYTNSDKTCDEIAWILNKRLPGDINIKSALDVPKDFNARRSAKGKHYRYKIWAGYQKPVFEKKLVYWCPCRDLDIDSMICASKKLIGTHDFSSFASNSKKIIEDKIRHVAEIEIKKEDNLIVFDVKGVSFLYKMVRGICGTLFEMGRGKKIDIEELLESKDRTKAQRNLPGHGLYLVEVYY